MDAYPVVLIDGKAQRELPGTTLGDLQRQRPNAYLLEHRAKDENFSLPPLAIRQPGFLLKQDTTYELVTPVEPRVLRRLAFHELIFDRIMSALDNKLETTLHTVPYPDDVDSEVRRFIQEGVDKRVEQIFLKTGGKLDAERMAEGKMLLEHGNFVAQLLEKYMIKAESGVFPKEDREFLGYLKNIALANCKDYSGNPVFTNACLAGCKRVTEFMLEKVPEVINQLNDYGKSAFVALIEQHENEGELDLEFVKELYKRDDLRFTMEEEPIVRAFEESLFVTITKTENLPKTTEKGKKGKGGEGDDVGNSSDSFFGDDAELVNIMTERNPDVAGLALGYFLKKRTDIEVIHNLLKKGPNVNVKDFDGNTPIIFAIIHRDAAELVPLLLKHNADPSARDFRGRLPIFHETFQDGKKEKIWQLLFDRTNISAFTKEEIVELFLQQKDKREDIFMKIKIDPNMVITQEEYYGGPEDDETIGNAYYEEPLPATMNLLTLCLHEGDASAVEFLLYNGANVNLPNDKGMAPPLFYADTPKVLDMLLKNGADPNAIDNEGKTALIINAKKGKYGIEMMKVLLKHKADKDIRDKSGKTALDYSTDNKAKGLLQ